MRDRNIPTIISLFAMMVSIVCCILTYSMTNDQRQYDRALNEVWNEMRPVYKDMNFGTDTPPKSFSELLRPIYRPVVGPNMPSKASTKSATQGVTKD